jgi:pimeloyl-ACP methyl ester carboxylesterase
MTARTTRTPDGRTLGWAAWGPPDGAPVVLLHGTPGSRLLRHCGGEYERQGLRVVTYDRPGYGLSTRRPGRTVAQSADDVAAVADAAGLDRFAVVGISGGGPSAVAAAAALADRVERCATIVGLGPSDAPDLEFLAGMGEEEAAEWATAADGEEALRATGYPAAVDWARWFATAEPTEGMSADELTMLAEAFAEGLRTPDGLVDDYAAFLRPWDVPLQEVTCPVRVMVALQDEGVPPAHGAWLAAHLPTARLVPVPGGHMGPRNAEEEDLLGWLGHGDG